MAIIQAHGGILEVGNARVGFKAERTEARCARRNQCGCVALSSPILTISLTNKVRWCERNARSHHLNRLLDKPGLQNNGYLIGKMLLDKML
ncbi:MAG: hypothetical protein PHH11_02650, partial [Methylomonas sp.]|nr:hypothetical protein [Methylomonas sp.]